MFRNFCYLMSSILLMFGSQAYANGDIAAGKSKSSVCAACHGIDGNGAEALPMARDEEELDHEQTDGELDALRFQIDVEREDVHHHGGEHDQCQWDKLPRDQQQTARDLGDLHQLQLVAGVEHGGEEVARSQVVFHLGQEVIEAVEPEHEER